MKLKQVLNVVALLITLLINGLANGLPFNGQTTGEVSAKVPVLFTPASYVFGIWGVIYLLLLVFVIYQALPAQHNALFLERIGFWFLVSCLLNCTWLFFWHYEYFTLTVFVMFGLLASLIIIYQRLDIGRRRVSRKEYFFVNLPLGVYLGWISVATLANVAIVLRTLHIDNLGFPPVLFTLLLLLLAAGLGIGMILRRNEIAYPVVISWALTGIAVRHQQVLPLVALPAAILACAVMIALLLVRLERNPELLNGIKTA